jgi:hypothetical protein
MHDPPPDAELRGWMQTLLEQHAAMLQLQTESVRLQRLLLERLLAHAPLEPAPPPPPHAEPSHPSPSAEPSPPPAWAAPNPPPHSAAPDPAPAPELLARSCPAPDPIPPAELLAPSASTLHPSPPAPPAAPAEPPPPAPPAATSRGNRYYQPRASSEPASARPPEHVDLLLRLQAMRDAGDLILQFGPHKGSTLAQVALADPAYVRELVTRAQRPDVRAAATRVAEALEAAEHKRLTPHRPRPPRLVS